MANERSQMAGVMTNGGLTLNPDGQVDALYAEKKAWHGLGHNVESCASIADVLQTGTLAWGVEKLQQTHPKSGKPQNAWGIYRDDRDDEFSMLGSCAAGYSPLQNRELLELGEGVIGEAGTGKFSACGSLHGGRRIFASLDIGKSIDIAGDLTNMQLVMLSSHDSSLPVSLGVMSYRPECENMVAHAFSKICELEESAGLGMTTRHSAKLMERIAVIKNLAAKDMKLIDKLASNFKVLAGKEISPTSSMFETVLTNVLQLGKRQKKDADELTEQAKTQVASITDAYIRNLNNLPDALQFTAYGLFQAVSFVTNHEQGTRITSQAQAQGYKEQDLRQMGMLMPTGTGFKTANSAWNQLLALCE